MKRNAVNDIEMTVLRRWCGIWWRGRQTADGVNEAWRKTMLVNVWRQQRGRGLIDWAHKKHGYHRYGTIM